MVQLSENEAKVYELLKRGYKQDAITKVTGRNRQSVVRLLKKLVSMELAYADQSSRYPVFTAIKKEYEVINRHKFERTPTTVVNHNFRMIKKLIIQYGADNVRFIKFQFQKTPVTYIAQKTGIAPREIERIALKLEVGKVG